MSIQPYIVRIVSLERKSGKTVVGTSLVSELTSRGFKVAVIKHAHSGLDIRKDSSKYLESGAEVVVATGPSYSAIYVREPYEDLGSALTLLPKNYGLIVVEGFKKHALGDVVVVVNDLSELSDVMEEVRGNVVAAVVVGSTQANVGEGSGVKVFRANEVQELASYIVDNATKHILSQTAKLNCGHCGYSSCLEFSRAYLRGEAVDCPVVGDVKLIVNGKSIRLSPFVKKVIKNAVLGLVTALKDVPKDFREIKELELSFKSNHCGTERYKE